MTRWLTETRDELRRTGRRWRHNAQQSIGTIASRPSEIWAKLVFPFRMAWKQLLRSWQTGHTRNLLFGLPAILIVIGVMVLSAIVRGDPQTLRGNYLRAADRAIAREDYQSAEIYLQRLLDDFGSAEARTEFTLGEVFEKTGREDRALGLYRRLAPSERRGYSPAHRKLALAIAEQVNSKSSGEEIRSFRWHLSQADQQRSSEMSRAWAAYYLAINQVEPAIERLEAAVSDFPELSLLLGNLYLNRRKLGEAQRSYLAASDFLRERLEDDPENSAIRATFANTLLKLGEINECEAVLRVGLKLDPEGPYKQLLASLYTNRHDQLARDRRADISRLLKELHAALEFDPTYTPAYERLVAYSEATVEGGANLSEILNEVIARGEEPGLAHFAMALLEWKSQDVEASRWHLERAHKLLPEMPFVANNLAWIVATEDPTDIERAFQLIDPAVKKFPDEPRLLDTRAEIMMRLLRWTEAYDDLERALRNQKSQGQRQALHEKLAHVCDELGQTDLAEKHRRLASSPEAASNGERERLLPSITKPAE